MTGTKIIVVFMGGVWAACLLLEGISCQHISMEKEAKLNRDPLRIALTSLKMNVLGKYQKARDLAGDPHALMSNGEVFVLTSKFDYDTASPEQIEAYYKALQKAGVKDLPPLWDKEIRTAPLPRR